MGLEKIKELSKIKNISIEELAEMSTVPKSTLNKIINGITENPGYKTILSIANALSLSADEFINLLGLDLKELKLNSEEENIVRKYKQLSKRGKGAVNEILEYEYAYESELKKQQQKEVPTEIYQISVPTTTRSYAAGTASIVYDGDDQVTDINYPSDRVPKETEFASRVDGDSMEPTFFDGDIVFLKHADILKIGEIGLLNVNGENYIKECGEKGLVSHNKKYPLIKPTSQDTLVCVGKVLGKL